MQANLQSNFDPQQEVRLRLSVVTKLSAAHPPKRKKEILDEPYLKELQLADPDLEGAFDVIIGSLDHCRCVLGVIKYHPEQDIAVSPTIFGWTVTGPLDYQPPTPVLKIQVK